MTKGLTGLSGHFFGTQDRQLEIENFPINVIDTPGFADDNEDDRRKNAQKISQALDVGVNAFLYVTKDIEFKVSANVQKNFDFLHRWTRGAIWSNLLILIRQNYSNEKIQARGQDDVSYWTIYRNPDDVKNVLVEAARAREWQITFGNTTRLLQKVTSNLKGGFIIY